MVMKFCVAVFVVMILQVLFFDYLAKFSMLLSPWMFLLLFCQIFSVVKVRYQNFLLSKH